MVQIPAGLIAYLLLAIYCRTHHREKVTIQRVRELRLKIQNEARNLDFETPDTPSELNSLYAKT